MAKKKLIAKSYSIAFYQPYSLTDTTPYSAQYEYVDMDGTHEVSNSFATYGEAYGWLAERVVL